MTGALFKEAMSRFASGVTVVIGRVDGELHGMTVAAFASVSAEPPMVLVCLALSSQLGASVRVGDSLSVSILPGGAEALALRFAGMDSHEGSRFDGVALEAEGGAVPLISGAAAGLLARVQTITDAGDHRVFLLDVTGARAATEASVPLVWWARDFAALLQ